MKRQDGEHGQPEGRSNERALTEKEILRLLRSLPPEDLPAARKLLDELEKGGRS